MANLRLSGLNTGRAGVRRGRNPVPVEPALDGGAPLPRPNVAVSLAANRDLGNTIRLPVATFHRVSSTACSIGPAWSRLTAASQLLSGLKTALAARPDSGRVLFGATPRRSSRRIAEGEADCGANGEGAVRNLLVESAIQRPSGDGRGPCPANSAGGSVGLSSPLGSRQ